MPAASSPPSRPASGQGGGKGSPPGKKPAKATTPKGASPEAKPGTPSKSAPGGSGSPAKKGTSSTAKGASSGAPGAAKSVPKSAAASPSQPAASPAAPPAVAADATSSKKDQQQAGAPAGAAAVVDVTDAPAPGKSKAAAPPEPSFRANRRKSATSGGSPDVSGGGGGGGSASGGGDGKSFKGGGGASAADGKSFKKGAGAAGGDKDASKRVSTKASKLDALTAEVLLQQATEQEEKGVTHQKLSSSLDTLPSQLGALLLKKFEEGMKTKELTKEFFEKMDKNGDGSISKMEFRQTMRELGLIGAETKPAASKGGGGGGAGAAGTASGGTTVFTAKEADALFSELDKDGGGDLDLQEISDGLKELQLRAKEVVVKVQEELEQAEYWRARAARTRGAAEAVAEWEAAIVELEEARKPSVEQKLGALLNRKNLKPSDIVSQWDSDNSGKKGTIDMDEFTRNLFKLGIDVTKEELEEVFRKIDKSGDGELDMEELKGAMRMLLDARDAAVQDEKRLVKVVHQKEAQARAAQGEMRQAAEEDVKKAEAEAAKVEAIKAKEAEAAEAAKAEEEAKKAAKAAKEAKVAEEFKAKIDAKRKQKDLTKAAWEK